MASASDGTAVLDNMAWHAMRGPQADIAVASEDGTALSYRREVCTFNAVEGTDADGWAALAQFVGPGNTAILFRGDIDPPPDGRWKELLLHPVIQYVADELTPVADLPNGDRQHDLRELGADDAEEMLALAKLTEPGPFRPETYRMGRYVGLRRDGQLIAMAGERMRGPGWSEISGVCVHPSARREGLAALVTQDMAEHIRGRGDEAMLHVAPDNDPAHELYLKLGFRVRRTARAGVFRFLG